MCRTTPVASTRKVVGRRWAPQRRAATPTGSRATMLAAAGRRRAAQRLTTSGDSLRSTRTTVSVCCARRCVRAPLQVVQGAVTGLAPGGEEVHHEGTSRRAAPGSPATPSMTSSSSAGCGRPICAGPAALISDPRFQLSVARRGDRRRRPAAARGGPATARRPINSVAAWIRSMGQRGMKTEEREGFEPSELSLGGFQDRCLRPLGHLSGCPFLTQLDAGGSQGRSAPEVTTPCGVPLRPVLRNAGQRSTGEVAERPKAAVC